MEDQSSEHDYDLPYLTNRANAPAQNGQLQRYQHVPAQHSHRPQIFRKSQFPSHDVGPQKHVPVFGARSSCYAESSHQNSVTGNISFWPNDRDYRSQLLQTGRPSSWHADTFQKFCYDPRMPAFNATNSMPDEMLMTNPRQRHDYPDLLFSPVHDHQLYSASMMTTCNSPLAVMRDDSMPFASMQQTPSFAEFSDCNSFNQQITSVNPRSQDATQDSVFQYMPQQMESHHQTSGIDDLFEFNIAHDSSLLSGAPHVQTEDVDVVQEELIGLGLYDDGPNKMDRSITSSHSHRQPRALCDRPAFLLEEGWEPPEPDEHEGNEEYEEESLASEENFSYLTMPLQPAVYQAQQPHWPLYQNGQRIQPGFTYDQNALFDGANYWPCEDMGPIMTDGHEPMWHEYGFQYSDHYGP